MDVTQTMIFKRLRILTLSDSYKHQCCKVQYKNKLKVLHPYHSSLLKMKIETQPTLTRQSFDIIMTKSTTFQRVNNLVFKIGYSWNTLPYEIKSIKKIREQTFSKYVKSHFLSQYEEFCSIPNCYICNRL